jgi:hypothetical protein
MSPTRHDLNCFFPRNCTHATRARYLVHAEREILIFLYFKASAIKQELCILELANMTPGVLELLRLTHLTQMFSS